jgi:germination protein M
MRFLKYERKRRIEMFMSRRISWKIVLGTLILALALMLATAGCSKQNAEQNPENEPTTEYNDTNDMDDADDNDNSDKSGTPSDKDEPTDNNSSTTKPDTKPVTKPETKPDNKTGASTEPAVTKLKLTLYFSDNQSTCLRPETREVTIKGKRTAEAVINELIRGPKISKLSRTVPQESKLRSIKVESGVVYVNFSKEFQAKHSGGSAGETMTLYSITNSLAELPGVNKVQFLLEGKKVNSILGHTSTTTPLAPNWSLVEK